MDTTIIDPTVLSSLPPKWLLYGQTVLLATMVLGRIFTAIKNQGGLVGIYRAVVFGVTPTADKPATTVVEKVPALLLIAGLAMAAASGCVSNPAGRALATATTTVDAAMQSWAVYVVDGKATPQQEAVVKDAYTKYQAVELLAEKAYLEATKTGDYTGFDRAKLALAASQLYLIQVIEAFHGGDK